MWTQDERRLLRSLNTPHKIQDQLDALIYNSQDEAISPRWVMLTKDGQNNTEQVKPLNGLIAKKNRCQ